MSFLRMFFTSVFCVMLSMHGWVTPALSDETNRKVKGSGVDNTSYEQAQWSKSSGSGPCAGKPDGTSCKVNGSVGAKCKNQRCVVTQCDKNTYLVVRKLDDDKYQSEAYCTSRTKTCSSGKQLRTVEWNGQTVAYRIPEKVVKNKKEQTVWKFDCGSFDDVCTDSVLRDLSAVKGRVDIGPFSGTDACIPTECLNGYIIEGEANLAECVECPECNGTNANCKLTGSNGKNVCNYETSCKDGYGNLQHNGKYNPICKPNEYKITYRDGGKCKTPTKYTYGVGATVDCVPTKQGYEFMGWVAGDKDPQRSYVISDIDKGNITLTAKWKEIPKPEKPKPRTECNDEEKAKFPHADEFEFVDGVCKPTHCQDDYELDVDTLRCVAKVEPVDTNLRLEYKNTVDVIPPEEEIIDDEDEIYKITYELDGGKIYDGAPTHHIVGHDLVIDGVPTRDGYVFDGWCGTDDCEHGVNRLTIPGNAVGVKTIYAKWRVVEQPRTECNDDEKSKFPHADNFEFVDGVCKPTHCEKGYKLENGKCVDDGIKQAEDDYKSAKDTETSFENRMLGGATMAAMGIGGMEMARGIAEQNADNEADAIMDAYLKTFQCQIGEKGKTYSGGERNIEVPGANVLTDLYQQYTSIAESIKTKKTALGMRPGIESEIVLDKSGTGLYENAGTDTKSVKYASRYRAAMGSEKDTEDLQTETNKTTARALGGAAGVVGGATMGLYGNSVINGDNQGLNLNLGDIDMSTVGSIATEYMQSSE